MSDIKETKELVQSCIDAVDVISVIMEDGKVSFSDLRQAAALIAALKPGIDGCAKIKDELDHLDSQDVKDLADLGLKLALKLIDKLT